jgi:uncharacterized membrane protein YhiD involved in acid resistance
LNTPDVALLAAIAFLTTVQVYRNRLALISGTEEKEHDKELKKEIKKEEKQIDEIEKNIQQQEKQI